MKNESTAISYSINIPKDVTNGAVIKMVFPSCKTRNENTPSAFMEFTLDGVVGYAIEKSWWNTLYKADIESKESGVNNE